MTPSSVHDHDHETTTAAVYIQAQDTVSKGQNNKTEMIMSRGRFCAEEERDEDKIENIIQPPLSFFGRIILDCFGCSIYLLSISIVILFSFRFVSAVLDLPVDTLCLFLVFSLPLCGLFGLCLS